MDGLQAHLHVSTTVSGATISVVGVNNGAAVRAGLPSAGALQKISASLHNVIQPIWRGQIGVTLDTSKHRVRNARRAFQGS